MQTEERGPATVLLTCSNYVCSAALQRNIGQFKQNQNTEALEILHWYRSDLLSKQLGSRYVKRLTN
jgi:hypothetical protein